MKYLPLVIANILRKKVRSVLTVGSFMVALFLFGLLIVLHGAFNQSGRTSADRLVVFNAASIIRRLPYSYKDRLAGIAGVKDVTFATWFGGVYQDERNSFPKYAIDQETYRRVFREFEIPDDQWKAFLADREGCIVGSATAERFHWKIGDRIPLKGTLYSGPWEFNLRGIYRAPPQNNLTQFWLRYDYLNERTYDYLNEPTEVKGQVGWYVVRLVNPNDSTRIAAAIDDMFANSPYETKTETENSFLADWLKQVGNIEFLILAIGGVVFFTLLLVTGNTMAIALRERVRELAILKAVGFSDRLVLILVIAESLVLAAVGGALGLGLAKLFSLRGDPTHLLGSFYLPKSGLGAGLLVAIAVGIISAILPAVSAMRLRIMDALRRV